METEPGLGERSVRERLMNAATDLFTARGYAATSVREVAEGAGVTKPALYYHFGSKEGLYLAILEGLRKQLYDALELLLKEPGTARERVERLLMGLWELVEENTRGVRLMNSTFWGPSQGAPPFDFETLHVPLEQAFGRIVADGIAAGDLRSADPTEAAYLLIALLSFSMDMTIVHPERSPGREGLRRLVDLLFSGLSSPVPSRSPVKESR